MRFSISLAVLLFVTTCAPDAASSQDSPGFRGTGRDGHVPGFKAPADWTKPPTRGWQVEVGEGHATPALADGRLYAFVRQGEDEVTLALDPATGAKVWEARVPAPFEVNPIAKDHGKGPWSSPTVAGGKVYTFGMSGIASCLDAKTGQVAWRHDFKDRATSKAKGFLWYGNALSPLVAEGLFVVHAFGSTKGAVVARDAATGKERWFWDGDEPGYGSPILASPGGKPQIIVQGMTKTVGLTPADGKPLWEVEFKTNYEQNSITPVVSGNLVILSGTAKGVVAWKVDGAKPEQAWETTDVSMYMASPVLKGDRLFGLSEKKKGHFFCLDAKSGKTLWPGPPRQGESAAIVLAGDVFLGLTTGSELVVFIDGGDKYVEKARHKVAETPTWAHPVVSGKSIFVKDRTKLTQWTLP